MNAFTVPLPKADDIEARAKSAGLSIPALCRNAGIAATTFYRWKNDDAAISVDTLEKLMKAVNDASVPFADAIPAVTSPSIPARLRRLKRGARV